MITLGWLQDPEVSAARAAVMARAVALSSHAPGV